MPSDANSSSKVFALVDCNNFYVSCERLFNPALERKPVLVLSNNDGCIVARSNEAKELGIKMGIPLFKVSDLVRRHKITTLSSNYALYADLSDRVMAVLSTMSPHQEIYSIDECFLDFAGFSDTLKHGQHIRQTIKQWLGLPVCVGIGPSKTLAKLSNHIAKKGLQHEGVFDIRTLGQQEQAALLKTIPVDEVWGIGRKMTERLASVGVRTVADLQASDADRMQERFSVSVKRTVLELQGTSCLELDDVVEARKQIICSRSFGTTVKKLSDLEEAVATYAARAAEKLRRDKSLVSVIQVYIRTNMYASGQPQYCPQASVRLKTPTDDSIAITKTAISILRELYKTGYAYQKAGVALMDLVPAESQQLQLFAPPEQSAKSQKLMKLMDATNALMGAKTLYLAAEGQNESWAVKAEHRTPAYTTSWDSLPIAKA